MKKDNGYSQYWMDFLKKTDCAIRIRYDVSGRGGYEYIAYKSGFAVTFEGGCEIYHTHKSNIRNDLDKRCDGEVKIIPFEESPFSKFTWK